MRIGPRVVMLSVLLCAPVSGVLAGDDRRAFRVGDDVFVAGDEVVLTEEIRGDALMAGGDVSLDGAVGGDAILAGGRLRVGGTVGEDLYAAGGDISVTGRIGGSARITGGEIEIADGASVADGISIAGGRIGLNGHAGRYVQIAGGEVRINGRVDGDVNVSAGELVIGPNAEIEGSVTYRGPREARVSSSAEVRGGVQNIRERMDRRALKRVFGFFAFVWLAGWTVVGILLLALAPQATRKVSDTIRSRPWAALLLGVALVFAVPAVIVLCAITLVGIPLALVLLFAYLVLLPLGYLASVGGLGDWLLPKVRGDKPASTGMRIGMFVLALVAVYLLTRIPFLGGVLILALLLVGSGGIVLALARRSASP